MKKLLFIALLFSFLASDAQVRFRLPKRMKFKSSRPITGYVRQNLLLDWDFSGTVECTNCKPGDNNDANYPYGFNTGSGMWLDPFYNYQSSTTIALRQESTIVGKGGHSVKFTLNKTDPDASQSKRVELTLDPAVVTESITQNRWYGMSFYFKDWADDVCESVFQFHDVGVSPDVCPPLSIQQCGGEFILMRSVGCNNIQYTLGTTSDWSNRWVDIVLHVDWTTATTGKIECWVDGVKKVDVSGIKTQSNGGSYLKYGINKWTWAAPFNPNNSSVSIREFYMSSPRIGNEFATYNDVAP